MDFKEIIVKTLAGFPIDFNEDTVEALNEKVALAISSQGAQSTSALFRLPFKNSFHARSKLSTEMISSYV